MTHDQNKKTLRSFQCRDYLWEIFGRMSAELECSVDYLINEAMRQYARSRNYAGQSQPGMPAVGAPQVAPMHPQGGAPPGGPPPAGPGIPSMGAPRPSIPSAPPPPPRPTAPYGGGGGYSAPSAPPGGHYPPAAGPPGRPSFGSPQVPQAAPPPHAPPHAAPPHARPPSRAPSHAPPPRPSAPPPLPGQPSPGYGMGRPSLFVIFNGQKIPITKDEFVIGRGSKTADLPIKDGNISRRHAAVVFQGGAFYIKDLGSTNGIEYGGRRIDSKRIEEGDMVAICDYELRFTYR